MVKVKMFSSVSSEPEAALDMPELDAGVFYDVVDSRRSTRIYAQDGIPDEVIDRVVDAAQRRPIRPTCNAGNCTGWLLQGTKKNW